MALLPSVVKTRIPPIRTLSPYLLEHENALGNTTRESYDSSGLHTCTAEKNSQAFFVDFHMDELLDDYKRFFMKRLEKQIIRSSSILPQKAIFHTRHGSVETRGKESTMDNKMIKVQRQIRNYKKLILRRAHSRKTHEVVDRTEVFPCLSVPRGQKIWKCGQGATKKSIFGKTEDNSKRAYRKNYIEKEDSKINMRECKKKRVVLSLPNPYQTVDVSRKNQETIAWPIKLENLSKGKRR